MRDIPAVVHTERERTHPGVVPPLVEWALLDRDGVVVAVNDAWTSFAVENGGDPDRTGVGMNYLDVCAADSGDEDAAAVADAIRAALVGLLPTPMRIVLRCDSPREVRSFDVLISSRLADDGRCGGATVTLSRATGPSGPDRTAAAIASFLLGRIAEDAVKARAASDAPWSCANGYQVTSARDVEVATTFALSGREQRANAEHLARHDPQRVLSDCEAKRWIVQRCMEGGSGDGTADATLRAACSVPWRWCSSSTPGTARTGGGVCRTAS